MFIRTNEKNNKLADEKSTIRNFLPEDCSLYTQKCFLCLLLHHFLKQSWINDFRVWDKCPIIVFFINHDVLGWSMGLRSDRLILEWFLHSFSSRWCSDECLRYLVGVGAQGTGCFTLKSPSLVQHYLLLVL